jgi:DNA-binding MarR family transcriptional regulator
MDRERTIQRILELLERLDQAVRQIARGEWLNIDLTMPQLKAMLVLFSDGAKRMGLLASDLDVSMPTATGIIDRAAEKGLIERESDPQDRRVVLCHLSKEGHELISHLWKLREMKTRLLLELMTPEELQLVEGGSKAFLRAMSALSAKRAAPASTSEET